MNISSLWDWWLWLETLLEKQESSDLLRRGHRVCAEKKRQIRTPHFAYGSAQVSTARYDFGTSLP